jgi:hypothetical protein
MLPTNSKATMVHQLEKLSLGQIIGKMALPSATVLHPPSANYNPFTMPLAD